MRRSAPPSSRWVARVWRRVCGLNLRVPTAARVDEDRPAIGGAPAEVGVERARRRRAVRHHALLAALAEHAHGAGVAVDRVEVEAASSETRSPVAYSISS